MFRTPNHQPESWSTATLRAMAQAAALGYPMVYPRPPRRDGEVQR